MIKKTNAALGRTSKKKSSEAHVRRSTSTRHAAAEAQAAILSTNSGDSSDSPPPKGTKAAPKVRVLGSLAAYEKYLPAAMALPRESIVAPRVDVRYLQTNVGRGTTAVLAQRERIARELPALDLAQIEALPSLASAVFFSASQIVPTGADAELRALRLENRAARTKLLRLADVFVLQKTFDAATVKQIHEGRGPFDAASDTIALAKLFLTHTDAVLATGLITVAEIEQAQVIGSNYAKALTPTHQMPLESDAPVSAAVDARNRLYTLLTQRYDDVLRAGAWLFGKDVAQHVPALTARTRAKPEAKAPSAPGAAPVASGPAAAAPATSAASPAKEAPAAS